MGVITVSWRTRAQEKEPPWGLEGLGSHRRAEGVWHCGSEMLFLPLTVHWQTAEAKFQNAKFKYDTISY